MLVDSDNAAEQRREAALDSGLVAEGIRVQFGGLVAIDDVDLHAPRGEITGLIGPNGAGKTTSFNVCSGYQRATRGIVRLEGRDVSRLTPAARAGLGLGRTFQKMELFDSMTVYENVHLAAESRHITSGPLGQLGVMGNTSTSRRADDELTDHLIDRVGLGSLADMPAGAISTGQGRLVELARALARRPKILLLDEPSSGLDHTESQAFGELLVDVVDELEVGVLMVEHDMSLVLGICSWIHVLDFGQPLMNGTPDAVRTSDEVRLAYLGESA